MHQLLFLIFYLGLLPAVVVSPVCGALLYSWLDWLPPDDVYQNSLLPDYLSFTVGALAFVVWLFREKKTLPRPMLVFLLMAAYLVWINVTWQFALAPLAGYLHWNRTIKVVGFAILTAQMLSTRQRLEAYAWVFLLAVMYYSVPSAIKVMVSGGAGGIETGDVVSAGLGFFGDRVALAVVMSMALPFALYLGRHATLLPASWRPWLRPAMLVVAGSLLISLVGTFARTAVFCGGASLIMLGVRSRRKVIALFGVAASILLLLLIAPESWFERMDLIANYQSDASAMRRIDVWIWAWHFTLEHPIFGGGYGVFVLDAGKSGGPGWLEAHNIFFEVLAEHGFPGLTIFCLIMITIYCSCATIQRRVRGHATLEWAGDLARANQVAVVAFIAGGMFISIASAPFLYILGAMTIGVRSVVARQLRAPAQRQARIMVRATPRPAVSH